MNEELTTITADPWIRRGVAASVILLAVFLAMQTLSLAKEYRFIGGGVPATNTITVSGTGEVFAVPDIATFSFSVVERGETVKVAQDIATEKTNKFIAFLKNGGVDEKDIKTTLYNVSPRYEYSQRGVRSFPPRGERVLVGFEVRQTITIKVRDTKKAGELLSGAGEYGISEASGLQFTIDDEDALMAEARKSAIDDASAKGRQLANDLGVKLVRVVSFGESGAGPFSRGFAERASGDFATFSAVPEIPVGENKVVSRVSITYEIR